MADIYQQREIQTMRDNVNKGYLVICNGCDDTVYHRPIASCEFFFTFKVVKHYTEVYRSGLFKSETFEQVILRTEDGKEFKMWQIDPWSFSSELISYMDIKCYNHFTRRIEGYADPSPYNNSTNMLYYKFVDASEFLRYKGSRVTHLHFVAEQDRLLAEKAVYTSAQYEAQRHAQAVADKTKADSMFK